MKLKFWWALIFLSPFFSACIDVKKSPSPAITPTSKITPENTGTLGEYSFERSADGLTTRFKMVTQKHPEGEVISRSEVFFLFHAQYGFEQEFRELFTRSIATLDIKGQNGIALKTPVYNKETLSMPFYYVAIPGNYPEKVEDRYKDYFYHCAERPAGSNNSSEDYLKRYLKTFGMANDSFNSLAEHQKGQADKSLKSGAVRFLSPGGTPMISPCPFSSDLKSLENQSLRNIYTYSQKLYGDKDSKDGQDRINSLWTAAGQAINENYHANKNTYFSTEGSDVIYLHLRAQTDNRYYGAAKELLTKEDSDKYYRAKFPQ